MSEILQPDSQFYRTCILNEALLKKPLNKAFKHMKEVMPDLDYVDFEYWYFRFLNGNHDLNHDRSTDPKTPGLSDLPIDVLTLIMDKLDILDRSVTRNVSRALRDVIDKTKMECDTVLLELFDYYSCIIGYDHFNRQYKGGASKTDHLDLVLKDFSVLLMNPNWKFKELHFDFNTGNDPIGSNELKRIESKLSDFGIQAEQLGITTHTLAPMFALLPHFKSGVLESITVSCEDMEGFFLDRIVEMDQWKNAKELHMQVNPGWFSIEHVFHAREFSIGDMDLNRDRLTKIRDILFKSPTFESCSLTVLSEYPYSYYDGDEDDFNEEDFTDVFDDIRKVLRVRFAYNPQTEGYNVEHFNDCITLKVETFFDRICLIIEKNPVV